MKHSTARILAILSVIFSFASWCVPLCCKNLFIITSLIIGFLVLLTDEDIKPANKLIHISDNRLIVIYGIFIVVLGMLSNIHGCLWYFGGN